MYLVQSYIVNIVKIKSAEVNNFYVLRNFKIPTCQDKWVDYYPF